jgi:hypothetical protein
MLQINDHKIMTLKMGAVLHPLSCIHVRTVLQPSIDVLGTHIPGKYANFCWVQAAYLSGILLYSKEIFTVESSRMDLQIKLKYIY